MALEDGEYELDVSCLLEAGVEGSFALRYGFIPDSMDQTKPLILYQNEQETLLRASGTDTNVDSMIFEGVTQQIRLAANSSNEQFYLSYHGDSGENKVVLKKLDSTIRLSKSRNTKALIGKISQWEKAKLESTAPETTNQRLQIPKTQKFSGSSDSQANSGNSSNSGSPNKSSTFSKANSSTKLTSPSKLNISTIPTPQRPASQVASKRPPISKASTPDISNGDFEGLDDEEISFPTFTISGDTKLEPEIAPDKKAEELKKQTAPKKRETRSQKESKEPVKPPKAAKKTTTAPKKPIAKKARKTVPKQGHEETSDIDMDDAFKDLEDQLQEVLEEENGSSQIPHNDNRNNINDNNNKDHNNSTIKINSTNNNDQKPPQSTIGASNSNSIASNIVNDSFEDESDEDDYGYSNNPFVININEGEETKSTTKDAYTANTGLKPMSLRDLVGNRNDDMSSSEEE